MISARLLAYQTLLVLARELSYPDRLIRAALERHEGLDERDRALVTELVYGVLRWQERLDWHVDQLSKVKPRKISAEVRVLLRLGLYQILFLERIPPHAAVNETVQLAKETLSPHLTGFVNAILRHALRRHPDWKWPDQSRDPLADLQVRTSHPRWLVRKYMDEWGVEEAERLLTANNAVAPMVLRVNALKTTPAQVLAWLEENGIDAAPSPLLDQAIRIARPRRDITGTTIYHQGWIQIQDEASQIVSLLVGVREDRRVLDLCAGFGGKSTHLAMLMGNRGHIVALDQAAWKLEALKDNAARQGIDIIETVAADMLSLTPEDLGRFDHVLVDAPCSGFGSVRRNPDIKWRRHPKDPYRFARLQKALLQHAARFVRTGGNLVYATCTGFREENEEVVESFAAENHWLADPVADRLPPSCHGAIAGPYFRSWPHRHDMDGFFAACLRAATQQAPLSQETP